LKARASGDRSPLSAPDRTSLAQLDQSAGLRSRRSHVRVVHEVPFSSRRSQAVEGIWLQTRRREPTSVRIGPSSPRCLVSSADQSSRLLPGGSAVRIGHEAPSFFSPIAQLAEHLAVNQEVRGSNPRRGANSFSRVAQWQSSVLIRRRSMDRSHPRVPISSRCSAAGSAHALGA
jgi:hypothetical protein